MLEIWGRPTSINALKVLWCCEELALDVTLHECGIGYGGGLDTPDYRALNPNGLVPTIRDGDTVLWESHAILRYLCAKHGFGTLYPEDPGAREQAAKWMDWMLQYIKYPLHELFWNRVRRPSERVDWEADRAARREIEPWWDILDAQLAGTDYVGGDDFTMGDIPLGVAAHRYLGLVEDRPATPHLEAWHGRLQERPAFRKQIMIPFA